MFTEVLSALCGLVERNTWMDKSQLERCLLALTAMAGCAEDDAAGKAVDSQLGESPSLALCVFV